GRGGEVVEANLIATSRTDGERGRDAAYHVVARRPCNRRPAEGRLVGGRRHVLSFGGRGDRRPVARAAGADVVDRAAVPVVTRVRVVGEHAAGPRAAAVVGAWVGVVAHGGTT